MRILLIIVFTIISIQLFAQTDTAKKVTDTIAPYKKSMIIPSFSLLTKDSTWYHSSQLKPNKPTLILYFSPDCGHCQKETEEILTKVSFMKDLQIVMITSRPYREMKDFSDFFKIHKFPFIIIGSDTSRRIAKFYNVEFTPFSALYNKRGKLIKAYEKGIDMDELISFVN